MIALLAQHAEEAGFFSEFWHIFSDPAHIFAEAGWELITGIMLYPVGKWVWEKAVQKHDKEVHGHG